MTVIAPARPCCGCIRRAYIDEPLVPVAAASRASTIKVSTEEDQLRMIGIEGKFAHALRCPGDFDGGSANSEGPWSKRTHPPSTRLVPDAFPARPRCVLGHLRWLGAGRLRPHDLGLHFACCDRCVYALRRPGGPDRNRRRGDQRDWRRPSRCPGRQNWSRASASPQSHRMRYSRFSPAARSLTSSSWSSGRCRALALAANGPLARCSCRNMPRRRSADG